MHPRLTASNGRVAHKSLESLVQAERFVNGTPRQVAAPVADLRRQPDGALDGQLLFGAGFLVLEERAGWSFGLSERDGYVGYMRCDQLQKARPHTHWLVAPASHVYIAPELKSGATAQLSFGSMLGVIAETNGFSELATGGFIPKQHIQPKDNHTPDFVTVFESFVGVPYLWGGNSIWGMDCSGGLQLALHAAGQDCPRDSDMQEAGLGVQLDESMALQRGDLIFWQGHVGVMCDSDTLIHANAHHMAVAKEPVLAAIARIAQNGDGQVTSRRRL